MQPTKPRLWHLAYDEREAAQRGRKLAKKLGKGWKATWFEVPGLQQEFAHWDAKWQWRAVLENVSLGPVTDYKDNCVYEARIYLQEERIIKSNKSYKKALSLALDSARKRTNFVRSSYRCAQRVIMSSIGTFSNKDKK